MPEYGINFDRLEVSEAGAILVTLLAVPEADEETRAKLHRALCGLAFRARADSDPEWAAAPQPVKPLYALCPEAEIARALKHLKRRLRDRMAASRMAIALLQEAEIGRPPPLPAGIDRLSLNNLSEMVQPDTGEADQENIEKRVWRPSLPVIHLAAATQVLMQTVERNGKAPIHLGHLLTSREVITWIVREALRYEPLIIGNRRFGRRPVPLVRVRLAGE